MDACSFTLTGSGVNGYVIKSRVEKKIIRLFRFSSGEGVRISFNGLAASVTPFKTESIIT